MSHDPAARQSSRVANVEKTMEIFELLSRSEHGVAVVDLTRELGITASSASRFLSTLHQQGYVIRDAVTERYRLSLKFMALSARYTDKSGFDDICGPLLQQAARDSGELVQLALVEGEDMRYIARADVNHSVRVVSLLGRRAVPHAFATGKIRLAYMAEQDALRLALGRGLSALTPRTITSVDELQAEIRKVRLQGYATNIEEVDLGLASLAVPIVLPDKGHLLGALALTAPIYRLPAEEMVNHVPMMREIARQLAGGISLSSISRAEILQ